MYIVYVSFNLINSIILHFILFVFEEFNLINEIYLSFFFCENLCNVTHYSLHIM